ncbi:CynX/NimT family MFS transporter [Pseudalkalibacillus sp. A8]|uniref:CynX/NimT family MFS transporter n=1 Tax=Pseudalkalibacillus sp. A8 TaxID=3382641 RepID=UPI0038B51DFB
MFKLHSENRKQIQIFILVIGIVFVSFNLRPAITSVGPLIPFIRDDIPISNGTAGLLTSLPLIAFAIVSPLVPKIARYFTNERALIIGLLLIIVGIFIRSITALFLLLVGTLIIGIGIAICNVLLPSVIKDKFPLKIALMTSLYSTAMGIFAASASGLSIPFASTMNLGWQFSLIIWTMPAIIAILIWLYIGKEIPSQEVEPTIPKSERLIKNRIWCSPLAWQVSIFLGLQSTLFYVSISWLPEILHDYGVSLVTAGWMLSFAQFIGLPASLLVPIIAGKFKSQSVVAVFMGIFAICGYSGLLLGSSFTVMVISLMLIGTTLSGGFALALTFLGLRSKTSNQATELSGMAQSVGYLLAAIGPLAIGILFDLSGSWTIPLLSLIIISILVIIFGFQAGKDRFVLS